jgi:hypothetical protein
VKGRLTRRDEPAIAARVWHAGDVTWTSATSKDRAAGWLDLSCWTGRGEVSAKLLVLKAGVSPTSAAGPNAGARLHHGDGRHIQGWQGCLLDVMSDDIRRPDAEGKLSRTRLLSDQRRRNRRARSRLNCRAEEALPDVRLCIEHALDLSHDLGGVWYLEVLWLARPNLQRQSAIANQNPLDHVPVPDSKCWLRPCASLMPMIYRAMGP